MRSCARRAASCSNLCIGPVSDVHPCPRPEAGPVMNEDIRLSGQVAFVTGAAGAIGSAVAAELQARGARLTCVDVAVTEHITRHTAEAAAAEGRGGANRGASADDAEALAISADLTDEGAVVG